MRDNNMALQQYISSIQRVTPTPQPTPAADSGSNVSWGMIVPIVLIGVFLIATILCLYWHSWRKKRERGESSSNNIHNSSLSRLSRTLTGRSPHGIDFVRSSTRSTTPLRASARGRASVVPITHRQGKFTFYWDKDNWKLCPDGMLQGGLVRGGRNSSQLSPINEIDTPRSDALYSEISKTYDISATAPFSPYHLTWLTPQAPPPSYEESEISSPGKRARHQSVNTTSQSEDTCSACNKESVNSPFYPPHNTPTTEWELSQEGSSQMRILGHSVSHANNNSQLTGYPSTPPSSTASLTTSSFDTGGDTSFVTSYQDPSYNHNSRQSSEHHPSIAFSCTRTSQEENEISGIPSLASSILPYHRRMNTSSKVVHVGKPPQFSPHAYNQSGISSVGSIETQYTDNTSMLPNVGSSNTSGNPTSVSMQPSNTTREEPFSRNSLEEDLYKIVNEMSSIRANSNDASSMRHKDVANSVCVVDNIGQSYVNDAFPPVPPTNASTSGLNFQQSMTELFRSWSVTAELDYSSMSSKATTSINNPQNDNSSLWDNYGWQKDTTDHNHNSIDFNANDSKIVNLNLNPGANANMSANVNLNVNNNVDQNTSASVNMSNVSGLDISKMPMPGRKVQFEVPILVSKTYWV